MPADPTDTKDPNVMTEFIIETPAFRQAIATALAFTTSDSIYPALSVVRVNPATKNTIDVVGTDRYVLAIDTVSVDDGEPFAFSIPNEAAKRLLSLLPKPTRLRPLVDSLTTVTKTEEKVTVRLVGDVETAISFVSADEGNDAMNFIDYRELVDKIEKGGEKPADLMGFNAAFLARVCRVFADRSRAEPIRMRFRGHLKAVTVTQDDGLKVIVMPTRIQEYVDAKAAEVAA